VDVEELISVERHLQLMVNELNHRVKNTLSVVQSLAYSSFRNTRSPAENLSSFTERLVSLSRTHDILTAEKWKSADLKDVAAQALRHHGLGTRIHVTGPSVHLDASAAVPVGLALHELATNAIKYGALSSETGEVHLSWRRQPGTRFFDLTWGESGGPTVETPRRRGFGSRLIERCLTAEADANVELLYLPTGLVCQIRGPAADRLSSEETAFPHRAVPNLILGSFA
jgi:two-component system, chemotaxis family, CheB/CheR fusion protein